ncbi:MAG: hypothetical protein HZA89_09970 [Verrucomicrobia bacterium]|nr:hypothetical protein [Verrucomicrobiota bacterium]
MKQNLQFLAALAALTLVADAEDKLPKTLMTERGKLLFSEDFAKPVEKAAAPVAAAKGAAKGAAKKADKSAPKAAPAPWTTGWRLRPGKWEFADGAMKGTELKEDAHGAVARFPFKFKEAVIQYDVRLDGCKQTTFSVNDAKDHVCRVLINKDGFKAQKDDNDHAGPDKAKVFNNVALPLAPGTWHTVLIEIKGGEMVATMDGKSSVGTDPLIATDKANFGFTVSGDGASFRNLRVWEATANPAWEQNKKTIAAVKK